MRRHWKTAAVSLAVSLSLFAVALAQDAASGAPDETKHCLGVWVDHWHDCFVDGSWRIQRHLVSGRCRLLDPDDRRRDAGDYDRCKATFEAFRASGLVEPMKPSVVVLLHGLVRSRASMTGLSQRIEESGDFSTIEVGYPSASAKLDAHADALNEVLAGLRDAKRIHFVGHSMGNIVVRRSLAKQLDRDGKIDPRVGRIVMLGPPNQGASLARVIGDSDFVPLTFGPSAKQLGAGWSDTRSLLATPPVEFGILAGGTGAGGLSPILAGDDDFIVRVEETKLPGAADFRVLPLNHAQVRDAKHVGELTLRFLREGSFEGNDRRRPLAGDRAAP